MKKVLVSACLLGERVRYDGSDERVDSGVLARWEAEGRVVRVCPEVAGGLPVPRPPAELQPDGRIADVNGRDVSGAFRAGAQHAVALAREHGVAVAVLKEGSPSCGSSLVGDGRFTGAKVPGQGATTWALRAAGIPVFSELELEGALAALERAEKPGA
ncbi:MAG: DUF523 domain-containing protein [Myxococcales bacterium]|nr:DUF523 domain-containing protein [Myxococcales bacterium]